MSKISFLLVAIFFSVSSFASDKGEEQYQVCPENGFIVNKQVGIQQFCVPNTLAYTGPGANVVKYDASGAPEQYSQYGNVLTGCEQANSMSPGHYYVLRPTAQGAVCELLY